MKISSFVEKLNRVTATANGWQAQCPSHDDANPSLSVRSEGSKILLRCHAGCSAEEITSAMGLTMVDLFQNGIAKKKLVATYTYRDERGRSLFRVLRYEPKSFIAQRLDSSGKWMPGIRGVPTVPYRLPTLLRHAAVLITEGEKDADTGHIRLRMPTTTNPFGAGHWQPDYAQYFRNKLVYLVPDRDQQGLAHMHSVAATLADSAKQVKIVHLPEGKDLTDWCEKGGTREEFVKLLRSAELVTPEMISQWRSSERTASGPLQFTSLDELMGERQEECSWVIGGLLRMSGTSLVTAKPKVGKSTFCRCVALAVALGTKFLDRETMRGPVLYVAPQESRPEITTHFRTLGADGSEPIQICTVVDRPLTASELEIYVDRYNPVLVILDQLFHVLRVRDENSYAGVTSALQPIEALARRKKCHILLTHHKGKSRRADARDEILGSTGFAGSPDTIFSLNEHDSNRTIQTTQRYRDFRGELPETVLLLHPATHSVILGQPWSAAEVNRIEEQLLQEFRGGSSAAYTEEQLLSKVVGGHASKRRAIRRLCSEGRIGRSGKGRKGSPFFYSIGANQSALGSADSKPTE
jgi:hypothetical protein